MTAVADAWLVRVETRQAIAAAVRLGMQSLRAEPPVALSEWAARHFRLAGESSHQKGAWEAWSFQLGMLDFMSSDDIEELAVQKSKRVGYALALDTPIPTPAGWTTMGDLRPGDQVFDEAGLPCTVQYCSPVFTDHACYRLTLCDGTEIVADEGHRWVVESRSSFEYLLGERGEGRIGRPKSGWHVTRRGVLDTGQIATIQSRSRAYNPLFIRNAAPLRLSPAKLPIPPYTLGLWLGDGHRVTPRITQHALDVETADFIRAEGIDVSVRALDCRYPNNMTLLLDVPEQGRPVSPWAATFRALGLLKRKHIPPVYLRASLEQRLQLLRGLMDSDGTVGDDGRCEFTNVNADLAHGLRELLASLGIKSSMRHRARKFPHYLDQFRVNFRAWPEMSPFNLTRKQARLQAVSRPTITHSRRIVRVDRVATVPVRCIQVDSPSHLFLCSRAMVPTHNTKMLTACIAYNVAHRRRKQAIWQPTDDDRDSFVKSEIQPVLDGVPALRAARRRGSKVEDTVKYKAFRDSVLHLLGGRAARAYRRITVAVAMLDEWDAFDQSVEKSGDPGTLAKGRLEGAPYPKFIGGTTPRIKNLSHVERAREGADVDLRFHIACPHCGVDHPLVWGGKTLAHGMKWERGRPETIRHVCPHCRESITQADYLVAGLPPSGEWVCQRTGLRYGADRLWRNAAGHPVRAPRRVGLHIWAAYSPQRTWASIAEEFEQAHKVLQTGDAGPMQAVVNETLGETWELQGARSDEDALRERAEDYELGTVPVGGLVLTAGIDVQDDRWEVAVWAWGRGLESWVVDHQVIEGNPAAEGDWERLDVFLEQRFRQLHHGGSLGITGISIDSGHHTQAVYHWVRTRQSRLPVQAVKGASQDGVPIKGKASPQDVTWRGKSWPGGLRLWVIGTDSAKDLLHGHLALTAPGPGYVHFSRELPAEWYRQLTGEQRILVRTPQGEKYRWVKRRPRNEVLDCRNYALHAAFVLGLDGYKERQWARLEATVQPPPDLFSKPVPAAAPAAADFPSPADPVPLPRRSAASPAFSRSW